MNPSYIKDSLEWKDFLDTDSLYKSDKKRHISGNRSGVVSTVFAIDTEKWETMFISPKEEYFCLQVYDTKNEAREGHIFWAKKVREGFIPTSDLINNFGIEACLKFMDKFIKGEYERTKH